MKNLNLRMNTVFRRYTRQVLYSQKVDNYDKIG